LVIRWFRSIATTSTPGDPTGSGRGFGTERDPARLVFYGMAFGLAAILFNAIWGYARHDQRLLGTTIDAAGARAISRRFRLAVAWIATGTLLGALLPVLGMAVIAAFIPYYWLPIRGEIASAKPRRDGRGQA
jgi:TMEM175 potassium channel family protein